ncbi:hypothetical protein V2J09_004172 [Rumex salicifolius]
MAEEDKTDSNTSQQFVEVICTSSQKTRRFIQGVKAGFALTIINQKLVAGNPIAIYIEAAKEGEEPIVFAPDSLLRSCGDGWKLHTVVDSQGIAGRGAAVQIKAGGF